jgi:D-alanine-D-alanine ligase
MNKTSNDKMLAVYRAYLKQQRHAPIVHRILILAGGTSGEREVSLDSGTGMRDALLFKYDDIKLFDVTGDVLALVQCVQNYKPDVIINALHGVNGEDGVIQGVLELLGIPYTHSGVTASAVAMDKVLSRIIFMQAGIPVPTWELREIATLKDTPPAMPFVLKPRCEGSSLGVHIVRSDKELVEALSSWQYGNEAIVERYIKGKEIQTAVLNGKALGTIEIRPHGEFFDYSTKYTSGAAEHIMPADISTDAYACVQTLAEVAYRVIGCRGITRLDFMYADKTPYLLELNTQPGMTSCSLVPDIAKHVGLSYLDVIELMIFDAVKQRGSGWESKERLNYATR